MDLVSVIIPYFKKIKFIEETINSVISQTYKKLEIIIIYDDKDRKDLSFIKKLKKNDKRIKVVVNKKSLGAGLSRNLGIRISKGKFIGFIDADDMWKPNKIKLQLNIMKSKNYLISHTSYKIIDENNKVLGSRIARNFDNIDQLLKSCDIGLSTVMINKSLLKKKYKFPNLKTIEDFVLWLRILENNISIFSINKKLTNWRKTTNSLSSSTLQKLLDGYRVYNIYMNFNPFKSLYYLFFLSYNFLKK